tara:strand:- start:446 stop:994 length:549 start_codon:yes stop_codon:yes gene_type:complete
MSSILYYSNFCENCGQLLSKISKSDVKKNIHFICIDKRIEKNGSIYVVLENNQQIVLPNTITSVPSLLLINNNYRVLTGNEILEFLKPVEKVATQKATNFNGEPSAFAIDTGFSGVVSDNFSFLDQNSDDLSAKGDGGMRQLYSYATINHNDTIETPPDDFVPDKVNEESYKNYEKARNNIQ